MNVLKKLRTVLLVASNKVTVMTVTLLVSMPGFADDNPIPVSPDDVPTSGSDLITKFILIIKEFGKLLLLVGAIWLLWAGLSGVWGGYKEFRRTSDFTPLKEAIAGSALMIVVGAVILALLVIIVNKS